MRAWPVVNLISAGSHGMLWLDLHVSVQFWSGLEQLFSSIPPPILPSFFFLYSNDLISVDGYLEWELMAGLCGFASHGDGILSGGWLDTVEAPGYPRHPPSI